MNDSCSRFGGKVLFLSNKPRHLKPAEIALLTQFLHCEITLDELLTRFGRLLRFEFKAERRTLEQNFLTLECGIRVEPFDIERAVALEKSGAIAPDDLMRWATFVLLCDAYIYDGPREDAIADKLHVLSMSTIG